MNIIWSGVYKLANIPPHHSTVVIERVRRRLRTSFRFYKSY